MKLLSTIAAFAVIAMATLPAYAAPSSVFMEDMTWMEIKNRIVQGSNIAIVPTGGTEQNGPQMVVGKHNLLIRYTAAEIARRVGNTLVAPVMAYVPEGRIEPAEGHMRFPGTLSLSDETFAAVLEDTARSLKQNGFALICFIGEHGGSQDAQAKVAEKLTSEWRSSGVRVLNVSDYYSNNGQERWARAAGIKMAHIDAHAGLADTSELMALGNQYVRDDKRGVHSEKDYYTTGAMGDSSIASAAYGRHFLSLKIAAAVKQIQSVTSHSQ